MMRPRDRPSPYFDSGQPYPAHLLSPSPPHPSSLAHCCRCISPPKSDKILFYILPSSSSHHRPAPYTRPSMSANNGDSAPAGAGVPKPRSPLIRPKPLTPARATPPKSSSGANSAGKGQKTEGGSGGGAAGSLEEHDPVDPAVLANAMANLDTLRKVKTPSASAAPSAATSPAASGASSPNPGGVPTHGLSQTVMLQGPGQPAGGVPVTLQMAPASQPPTPAVPAQGQQQASGAQQGQGAGVDVKMSRPSSAPGTPHFGAQSEM